MEARVQAARTEPLWIVTANPEILLEARRNTSYADTLRQSDVSLVDGFGLWLMLRLFGERATRLTGIALAEHLVSLAAEKKWRVGFFGGREGVAAEALKTMTKKYPHLVGVAETGGVVSLTGESDAAADEATHRMVLFDPEVLLVALGHPKQERWIQNHTADFPRLKVIVGIGGTFDVWSGRLSRAPRLLRVVGLEWVWRLVCEPQRWYRIIRAVFLFPFWFLVERISRKGRGDA